jgi:hypothetical protein
MSVKTREEWLLRAIDRMRSNLFARLEATVPPLKVSVGFPIGSRPTAKNQIIGQYFNPKATVDGIGQIFVSPMIDDPMEALAIVAHELCHAVYPEDGHGKKFGALARSIGLEGKLTQTYAGEDLKAVFAAIIKQLGEYPHAAINLEARKTQSTRLIKVWCQNCGYTVRTSEKWLKLGTPTCVCGAAMTHEGDIDPPKTLADIQDHNSRFAS